MTTEEFGSESRKKARDLSVFLSVQTGSEVHSASYLMSAGDISPEATRQECGPDHSQLSVVRLRIHGTIPPIPIHVYGVVLN
jgi:hypothetical protein